MPDIPSLSDREIEAHFYGPYFQRGKKYFLEGNIINTIRRGNVLEGQSFGSMPSPYRVKATLGTRGIEGTECSCPIGGGCKHAAALLLTWVHAPEHFMERESVESILENRSKFELLAIIQEMLKRQPELEDILDLPVPGSQSQPKPVDPELYRRQVRNAFFGAHDWGTHFGVPAAIASVVDMADQFAEAEDWTNASTIYQVVVEEGCANYENAFHDEGDVVWEITRAGMGLANCFPKVAGETIARQSIMRSVFELIRWDIQMGGIGAGEGVLELILDELSKEERRIIRSWLAEEVGKTGSNDRYFTSWRKSAWASLLLELDERDDDVEGFLHRAEAFGMYRALFQKLVQLQRVEEAVKIATEFLSESDYGFLESAQTLENAGYGRIAFQMVNGEVESIKDHRLLGWLAEKYEESGDLKGALDLLRRRWRDRPTLDDYIQMKKMGIALGSWREFRPEILSGLSDNQWADVLARIHLHEEDWDAAWEVVDSLETRFWGGGTGELVARATEKQRPEKAMRFYLLKAEQLIGRRGRENYAAACEYMSRVWKISDDFGRLDKWAAEIRKIRENHRNLPALQDEMNKAKL